MADHMTAEQLLNCPFCEQRPLISATGSGGIKIECQRCGLTMRRRIPHHYPEHWTRERVVARWNNRPGIARLSGMAAEEVPVKYFVRQHIKHAGGAMFVDIYTTAFERGARNSYASCSKAFPGDYFELLAVTHKETCLDHTGKTAAPEPPHV